MNQYPGYSPLPLRDLQLLQLETMKSIHCVCVKHGIRYYLIAGSLLGAVRHGGFIPWDDDIDIAMMRSDYEHFKKVFTTEFSTDKYFLQDYTTDPYHLPALMRLCIKGTILDNPSESHHKNCKNTYIDIFPLDNIPDSEEMRKKHSKNLKRIDRLMELKRYHIYPQNSILDIFLKRLISAILCILPIRQLRKVRIKEMTKYDNEHTCSVCSTVSQYSYAKQSFKREIFGTPRLYKFEDTEFYGPEKEEEYLHHLYGANYMQIPPENKRRTPANVFIKSR